MLAQRFAWDRPAPFGEPVVPEVYSTRAISSGVTTAVSISARPSDAEASFTRSDHSVSPSVEPASSPRSALSGLTGIFSAVWRYQGIARVMVTGMICSSGETVRSSRATSTALSQNTPTFAPWSLKATVSSRAVYSGLCSVAVAPRESTA